MWAELGLWWGNYSEAVKERQISPRRREGQRQTAGLKPSFWHNFGVCQQLLIFPPSGRTCMQNATLLCFLFSYFMQIYKQQWWTELESQLSHCFAGRVFFCFLHNCSLSLLCISVLVSHFLLASVTFCTQASWWRFRSRLTWLINPTLHRTDQSEVYINPNPTNGLAHKLPLDCWAESYDSKASFRAGRLRTRPALTDLTQLS